MKTQEQWEKALKAGKYTEAVLKIMSENLKKKKARAIIAFSLGDKSILRQQRVCKLENTADVAIAKILGIRLKLTSELIMPSGTSRPGALYTTDGDEEFMIVHDKLDMKGSISLLAETLFTQELTTSMRKAAARLLVEEKGEEIEVITLNDDCAGEATEHIHKAFLKVIDEMVAERQKEIRTFIELIKGEEVVKKFKIPKAFIQLTETGVSIKNGAGVETVPLDQSVVIEIHNRYADLPVSTGLLYAINQNMLNSGLKIELDKTGAVYKIDSDSFGITTVEILPSESTIVLDGHEDDLARVVAWIAKEELKVYTSTSDQPL
jgi:hypothetical protein